AFCELRLFSLPPEPRPRARSIIEPFPATSARKGARLTQPKGLQMTDKQNRFSLDDLARQLAQSLPQNLRALGDDLERNFRALLHTGPERMQLVTREEFDGQSAVLERTREKLEALEARLAELERDLAARSGQPQ